MTVSTRIMHALATGAIVFASLLAAAPRAKAAFVMTLQEVGSDVDLMGSGSINLAGLSSLGTGLDQAAITPAQGVLSGGPLDVTQDHYFTGLAGPTNIGSGGLTTASAGSGDLVVISGSQLGLNALAVPLGYVSGTALEDTATFTGASLASLGVTPGTYVWTWGSGDNADSFTLDVVPEPATASLIILPVAAMLLTRRRAKTAT